MKKLFEQLDFSALGDPQALDPSAPINRTKTNTGDDTKVIVTNNKLDMSVLKPFKPVSVSDNGKKVTVNNNTYTFYPNGKVWDAKLKKHVTWSTKNGKVFVAGFELKPGTSTQTDKDKEIAKAKRLNYQASLIKNAIIFYEDMCRQMMPFDWNEDYILKLIAKYVTPDQAPYIDALIRMITPDRSGSTNLRDTRRKYLTQYNYWLSRGGKSGTTFQYLAKIPNKYMYGGIDSVISSQIADYLDLDSNAPKIVKLKKQLISVFPNIMKHTAKASWSSTKLNNRLSDAQIHKMVMDIYNTKAFGPIKKL